MSNRLARLISLAGRRAVVCGGGGGIGSAVTRLFLEAGAEVTSLDLPGRSAPAGARSVDCDVADAAAVKAFFEDLEEREERLDALVHCAGITRDGVLWKMPDEAWSAVLRVNLDSAFYLLKGA
ncbi:MAG: SDR family oxidoreductase, partial [Planctomycetota bacterium]